MEGLRNISGPAAKAVVRDVADFRYLCSEALGYVA